MPIEKAKKHFLGTDGHERLNCARSIFKAFSAMSEEDRNTLGHGGGKAPAGECGAYFAARHLLEKNNPEKLKEFEEYFTSLAGSTKCREIRRAKKIPCLECVEKAAVFLHSKHTI